MVGLPQRRHFRRSRLMRPKGWLCSYFAWGGKSDWGAVSGRREPYVDPRPPRPWGVLEPRQSHPPCASCTQSERIGHWSSGGRHPWRPGRCGRASVRAESMVWRLDQPDLRIDHRASRLARRPWLGLLVRNQPRRPALALCPCANASACSPGRSGRRSGADGRGRGNCLRIADTLRQSRCALAVPSGYGKLARHERPERVHSLSSSAVRLAPCEGCGTDSTLPSRSRKRAPFAWRSACRRWSSSGPGSALRLLPS